MSSIFLTTTAPFLLPFALRPKTISRYLAFGIKFGINDKQLLLLLRSNPSSTAADIAEQIGISQRAVEKQIKKLKDLGIINREGSRKNGLWVINKEK